MNFNNKYKALGIKPSKNSVFMINVNLTVFSIHFYEPLRLLVNS
jgi:hypothetical protein